MHWKSLYVLGFAFKADPALIWWNQFSERQGTRRPLRVSLGFHSLHSLFNVQSEQQNLSNLVEVSIAESNLLQYTSNGDFFSSIWRTAHAPSVCNEGSVPSGIHEIIAVLEENVPLFTFWISIWILLEYMRSALTGKASTVQIVRLFQKAFSFLPSLTL